MLGYETGSNGTRHIQGYVVFINNCRFNRAKSNICLRAHLELARGTHLEASAYCKKDGNYEEFGELPTDRNGRAGGEANKRRYEDAYVLSYIYIVYVLLLLLAGDRV